MRLLGLLRLAHPRQCMGAQAKMGRPGAEAAAGPGESAKAEDAASGRLLQWQPLQAVWPTLPAPMETQRPPHQQRDKHRSSHAADAGAPRIAHRGAAIARPCVAGAARARRSAPEQDLPARRQSPHQAWRQQTHQRRLTVQRALLEPLLRPRLRARIPLSSSSHPQLLQRQCCQLSQPTHPSARVFWSPPQCLLAWAGTR